MRASKAGQLCNWAEWVDKRSRKCGDKGRPGQVHSEPQRGWDCAWSTVSSVCQPFC